MGWPDWLDRAEELAKRDHTCLEHMKPFESCRWTHEWRNRVGDPYFWLIVATAVVAGAMIGWSVAVLTS